MFELNVDLSDTLTPRTCSKLINHLIKFILYQSEQIPMSYDALVRKKSQISGFRAGECTSITKLKAEQFLKAIETLLTSCERTFEFIESELKNCGAVREIVIIVGATIIAPKKTIRISLPIMSYECENHQPSRNIQSLCKHIISSDAVHDYFSDKVGPTNIYVFLKVLSNYKPGSEFLLLREGFNLSRIGKQIKINLEQPDSNPCPCRVTDFPVQEMSESSNSSNADSFTWFQSKISLKGLKDCKAANSLFNTFNSLNKSC